MMRQSLIECGKSMSFVEIFLHFAEYLARGTGVKFLIGIVLTYPDIRTRRRWLTMPWCTSKV